MAVRNSDSLDSLRVFTPADDDARGMTVAGLAGLDQFGSAKLKLDELFLHWLSLQESQELILSLLSDLQAGHEITVPSTSLSATILSKAGGSSPIRTSKTSPPPRSPGRPFSPPSGHFSFDGENPPSPVAGFESSGSRTPERVGFPGASAAAGGATRQLFPEAPASPTLAPTKTSSPAQPPAVPRSPLKTASVKELGAPYTVIPKFFDPSPKVRDGEQLEQKLSLIIEVFRAAVEGRQAELEMPPAVQTVAPSASVTVAGVTIPSADLKLALKDIINTDGKRSNDATAADDRDKGAIPLRVFIEFWRHEMEPYDEAERFFRLVKQVNAHYIVRNDFFPYMEELLAFHPGLAFLENTPEFQDKYARTVVARIFYMLDPHNRGCITLRTLRRSNLLAAFHKVDVEEDINAVNEYFSYEHFYVLYCKFWELDSDHDYMLSREDLARFDGHALNNAAIDRIFSQAGRPFSCKEPNKMGYEDFVCFLLSEEDKTNPVSLAYWFRTIDLNGDGVITVDEMKHFFAEQRQRMEDMHVEVVKFEDVLCQMSDLLRPAVQGKFVLRDFLQPGKMNLTGVFFSILTNLPKFTAFEHRDPFMTRQQQDGLTAWDRFAQVEYGRLAMEEEAQEADDMSLDGLDESHQEVRGWAEDDNMGGDDDTPF